MKEQRIMEVLDQLGIPDTRRGYYYLTALLEEMLQKGIGFYVKNLQTKLFPKIAESHNSNIRAISRSVEVMSELAFKEQSDLFCEIWGTDLTRQPTVSTFLVKLARYIQKLS